MGQKIILVIDDQLLFRELIGEALASRDIPFHCADSGSNAFDFINEQRDNISLIILDYHMPGMTGSEFLQKLRGLPSCERIPVAMLTENSSKDAVLETSSFGIAHYLLKSEFSLDKLFETVKKYY